MLRLGTASAGATRSLVAAGPAGVSSTAACVAAANVAGNVVSTRAYAAKDVEFGTKARSKMLKGVNLIADAVQVSVGRTRGMARGRWIVRRVKFGCVFFFVFVFVL